MDRKKLEITYEITTSVEGFLTDDDLRTLTGCMEFKLKGATVIYLGKGVAAVTNLKRTGEKQCSDS